MKELKNNIFEKESTVEVNGKMYIVNRHFVGKKPLTEVVHEAILLSITIDCTKK